MVTTKYNLSKTDDDYQPDQQRCESDHKWKYLRGENIENTYYTTEKNKVQILMVSETAMSLYLAAKATWKI